jgi:hypothetical protein
MSLPSTESSFDFQTWTDLARRDPAEFEAERRRAVDRVIAEGADSRRLRGMQFRIDLERMRAPTPLKSCLTLYRMMWDSLMALNAEVEAAQAAAADGPPAQPPARPAGARIIPFRRA